jgi:N,N-dimethylformamidase beta subunit-like, C-terminal
VVLSLIGFEFSSASPEAAARKDASNPIRAENRRPGTTAWNVPLASDREVEGYASDVSLTPGQLLRLHMSTAPAARYQVRIYRLGWYRGKGGRLLACTPTCLRTRQGVSRAVPAPDSFGRIAARWPVTDSVRIGRRWVSGYYVAVARLRSGRGTLIPFIVRSSRRSRILVQAAVTTWQAYNNWGGKSLYAFNSAGAPAVKVSFDRPYTPSVQPLSREYPLVRFLERAGYDVSYTTGPDTDRSPRSLLQHRLVISAGHDEYWTTSMRDAFEGARDAGVNLIFAGADVADWQIRFENRRRTVVEYRSAASDPWPIPTARSGRARALVPPRPECLLLGNQFQGGIGRVTDFPVANAALGDPWFAETGFAAGSVVRGVLGYEWAGIESGCPRFPLTVLFHSGRASPPADAVRYTAPSGARVFSTGSVSWSWGLDSFGGHQADRRLQRFMRNAISDLSRRTLRSK